MTKSSFLVVALGVAWVVHAVPAFAEAPDAPNEQKDDAPAKPQLVVVADARSTATENAHLRAVLYDVAREAGYDAAGKLDVEEAAGRASVMRAGVITAEPAELGELRRALGVAVVVRVSKDEGGGIRLGIVTKRGTEQKVLAAADAADDAAISAVLKSLLPAVFHAEDPRPVHPSGAVVGTMGLAKKPPDDTVRPHDAWEARGGLRPMYGAMLLASGTVLPHIGFSSRGRSGEANATGIGGGIGVRAGFVYLPIPDPKMGVGSFVAVRFGIGLDTNVLYTRWPSSYDSGGAISYTSRALWVSGAPLYLGFAIAAGKFPNDTSWRGALIGFGYAPAAQFQMDLRETSGKFRFNPAGAELSVDITKLDVSEGADAEAQIRVALSGLVPLGDDRPGFISAGLGVIWY